MLDVMVLAKALVVGALTAAAVMRVAAWALPRARWQGSRWSWAIGTGVLAASGVTDQWPHWPPLEDRARFLTLVVPLTLLAETLAATVRLPVTWLVRLALGAAVTPILLHNSVYLAVLAGRDSAEWSTTGASVILCALAAVLAAVWGTLCALEARTSTAAVQYVLLLDALATAITVMLSGYYRAGLLGLGLAGAIAGAILCSYLGRARSISDGAGHADGGSSGMSVIGIFSVVVMGRFFGNLSTGLATCLLLTPLLAWIVELPRLRAIAPAWRSAGRLICVAAALITTVVVAQLQFAAASATRSRPAEPNASREPGK